MVSGPPFAEETPSCSDPRGLLVGELPSRMGGFTEIPQQRDLQVFADRTMTVAAAQYEYAIRQLTHRRWDLFFFTTLAIDRLEHYAWRHYDADQRRCQLSEIIPRAHEQLEEFVSKCVNTLGSSDQLILLSDHGHGARASTGVNLQEVLRRKGAIRDRSRQFERTTQSSRGTQDSSLHSSPQRSRQRTSCFVLRHGSRARRH